MRVLLIGAATITGTSPKTGQPYEIIELTVAHEIDDLQRSTTMRGRTVINLGCKISKYRGTQELFEKASKLLSDGKPAYIELVVRFEQGEDGTARSYVTDVAPAKPIKSRTVEAVG